MNARRDPYQVLGVARDADTEEIRRAFRERALRDHPDRNPNDPAAAERFKAASEAYATLRDPESRRRHDQFARSGVGGRAPQPDFGQVDWRSVFQEADVRVDWGRYAQGGVVPSVGGVVFEMLFRGVTRAFRQAGLMPGETRRVPLRIELDEARRGAERRVAIPGPVACPTCKGAAPSGVGCSACSGSGELSGGFEAMVRVPAGVRPGQKLRLAGLGGPGRPPGDAYVELTIAIPAGLELKGRDLHGAVVVTPNEARRGTTRRIAGLEVTVPAGARAGARLRVAGGGVAGGDLLLSVEVDVWRGLGSAFAQGAERAVQDSVGGARLLWRRMANAGRKP